METNNNLKIRANTANQHSYFNWGSKMQVVRKRNGKIAMTESELVSFLGVVWRRFNHRLQTIMISPNLHPEERVADEEGVVINGPSKDYAPPYPLPIIIALSLLLDSTETYLFGEYIY